MAMQLVRMVMGLGWEPREFPGIETERVTGWEDGTIYFMVLERSLLPFFFW
jgi:hypothetical protein